MIELGRIFTNWFKDPSISFSRLLHYATVHLQNMVADNPGALLNDRITATQAALNAVDAGVTDVLTKAGIQLGRTRTKEAFRTALPEHLRRVHGAVVAAFGSPSKQLTECFPDGRGLFGPRKCPDIELESRLGQLAASLATWEPQVGAAVVGNVTGLLSSWLAIYQTQGEAMAQRAMTAAQRDEAKAQLQLQLYLNVLELARLFPDQPEKGEFYCPQRYLRRAAARGAAGAVGAVGGSDQ